VGTGREKEERIITAPLLRNRAINPSRKPNIFVYMTGMDLMASSNHLTFGPVMLTIAIIMRIC